VLEDGVKVEREIAWADLLEVRIFDDFKQYQKPMDTNYFLNVRPQGVLLDLLEAVLAQN
jgi:hypothetical protein